jgi:hypothetical protein
MNSSFWKQFEGAPSIDCVQMKHDIQARIYEDTKDMNRAERAAYRQRRVAAFRAGTVWKMPKQPEAMVVHEDPTAYRAKSE